MNSKKKIIAAVLVIFIIISGLFLIGKSGFSILSGLRAFVGGEGLWAKSQKEAVFQLTQYVFTGEENRYQLFVDSLKVPLGDKAARLELEKTDPVDGIIIQGFIDGGNHPADIPTMIFLYKYFKNIDYIRKAIEQWQEGDRLIEDLLEIGVQTNHAIINNLMSREQAVQTLAAIDNLQKRLNDAEDLFSSNISSAARETANQLSVIMLCFSLVGIILCFIMLRLIVGIISDLNHKKKLLENQAEQESQFKKALEKSEEKYRSIFENSVEGLFQSTPEGRFISVNPAFAKMLGYASPEDLMANISDIASQYYVNHEDRHRYKQLLQKTGIVKFYEFKARCRDGSHLWVSDSTRAIYDPDGNIVRYEGQVTDITQLKQAEKEKSELEAQYRQAQKMESVGRLAGGVAHDYNNALTAIMGYTELAIMDSDPAGPLHADLNQVLKAGRRAQDITRQLLAFARKQTISPRVLNLNNNVESILKMLRRLIGEDIDLIWLPETGLWSVKMDPSQIDQILANLCVNARDAIVGVGKITIETDTIVFDSAYCADHSGFIPGEFVQLSVSDNGCGMDKEILNNIFEPFFTTKDSDKGTGLGLSMVYGIVKQNNGFINVYSEPGKGTTIKIYLPRDEGKVVEIQEESTAKIPQGQGETILLVEDDLPILELTEKILNSLDYTVLAADTPKGAMKLAREHTGKIHLLVTDVIMPEMNGLELSEHLQSLFPDLKYIFMSGYTANAIAHHGVLDEGVNFVQKPFSKNDLAKIIRKVLDE
ncbi:PAS domain S-box protein [Desulfobacula sp.]|uniref:PAS domain-containing hybrid sensor histidine kinase/response regulator n=1 Tax=Desulfobacula sp. TaxID=2593537 RepID=UPI001EB3526D|nr:PAS domain S-box protein [Desulfobacula sp.]